MLTNGRKGLIILLFVIFIVSVSIIFIKKQKKLHPPELQQSIGEEKITVPAYPKSTLENSATDPEEGITYVGKRFRSSWLSDDKVANVTKWYMDKYQKEGWELDYGPEDSSADIQLVSLNNGKYTLFISVLKDPESGKTKIITEYETYHSDIYEVGEEKDEQEL